MKCPLYLCDPEKNINCTKESRYINDSPCSSTTKVEYAFTNEKGEPIKDSEIMIPEEVQNKLNKAVEAFQKIGEELIKTLSPVIEKFINTIKEFIPVKITNTKAYYLMKHSKKARVRKKNLNRLLKG